MKYRVAVKKRSNVFAIGGPKIINPTKSCPGVIL